jgi:hypothetical protein
VSKKQTLADSVPDEENDLEKHVRKMLDPREPDEEESSKIGDEALLDAKSAPDVPDKLPTKISIVDHNDINEDKPNDKNSSNPSNDTDKELEEGTEPSSDKIVDAKAHDAKSEDELDEATEANKAEPEQTKSNPKNDSKSKDNKDIDEAVDDIIATEADDLLDAEDQAVSQLEPSTKPNLIKRLIQKGKNFWKNKKARRISMAVIFIAVSLAFIVPASRYFLLNVAGVRSSASIVVLDDSTSQPLKNVSVELNGRPALTNEDGIAQFVEIKLGRAELSINKRAFASTNKTITIGWGSNPLGDTRLIPVGSQYSFVAIDYLSGKPLHKIEAESEDANAISNENGEIKLTKDVEDGQTFKVILSGNGFRDEELTLSAEDATTHTVEMVANLKHVFVSKRTGKLDVYKIDADGKNEERILAGTGGERDDLILSAHPYQDFAALVSTRDNVRTKHGYLLSTLTLMDLSSKKVTKIDQSERIRIIGWINERLIYIKIKSGASAGNPKRHRLLSYNINEGTVVELAASNHINDVEIVDGNIYFAPSDAYSSQPTLFYQIKADGRDKRSIINEEVWTISRTDLNKLVFSGPDKWWEYSIDSSQLAQLPGRPADLSLKNFVTSPDGSKNIWVDRRDGKGVLVIHETSSQQETSPPLRSLSGLSMPIRWLNNTTIVYRIISADETADYVVSTEGGESKKIRDVTALDDSEDWYYY